MLLSKVVGPVFGLLSRDLNLNWLVQSGPQNPQRPSAGLTNFPNSEPWDHQIRIIK